MKLLDASHRIWFSRLVSFMQLPTFITKTITTNSIKQINWLLRKRQKQTEIKYKICCTHRSFSSCNMYSNSIDDENMKDSDNNNCLLFALFIISFVHMWLISERRCFFFCWCVCCSRQFSSRVQWPKSFVWFSFLSFYLTLSPIITILSVFCACE